MIKLKDILLESKVGHLTEKPKERQNNQSKNR